MAKHTVQDVVQKLEAAIDSLIESKLRVRVQLHKDNTEESMHKAEELSIVIMQLRNILIAHRKELE